METMITLGELAKLIGLEVLESADHSSNYEQPEKFNQAVVKFLK